MFVILEYILTSFPCTLIKSSFKPCICICFIRAGWICWLLLCNESRALWTQLWSPSWNMYLVLSFQFIMYAVSSSRKKTSLLFLKFVPDWGYIFQNWASFIFMPIILPFTPTIVSTILMFFLSRIQCQHHLLNLLQYLLGLGIFLKIFSKHLIC